MSLHILAAIYVLGLVAIGYVWHRAIVNRRNERATEDDLANMPLWPDRIAHEHAANLDEEWQRLSTVPCRDWPMDGEAS